MATTERHERRLEFGVNLNNREPLIAPGYGIPELLDLSQAVEELGFDSVWVGDSLFSKPRYEPITLLAAHLAAHEARPAGHRLHVSARPATPSTWRSSGRRSTVISGGRTIFGTGIGNPEQGVRREFEALGLDFDSGFAIFEEGLEILRQLWTEGTVTHHGAQYDYDDISFFSGTEMGPLHAHPASAAVLDRVQPAPRARRLGRGDGAHDEGAPAGASSGTARAG